MRKIMLFAVVFCVFSALCSAGEAKKDDMPSLQSFATLQELTARMDSTAGVKRFPPATERKVWDNMYWGDLQKKYTYYITAEARKILNTPWPECSLKLYTQYIKTGNRTAYQNKYSERRRRLTILALAECIENRGKYIEEIAEGMWQIISEPTWAYPAHERFNAPDPVPIKGKYEVVDLGASNTGLELATILELIEPQLIAYSPSLVDRVKKEIVRRVVEPLEADGDEPWWLRKVIHFPSNWIPWCCSNSFAAAAYVLKDDPERLAKLTWKMFAAVDKFIGIYMPDGACDEGPGYWNHSVAQMYQFMNQVNCRTNGLYDGFFKQPKIRRMGEFIAELNLTGDYYMNYADASSQLKSLSYGIIYSFGNAVNSNIMKSFILKHAEKFGNKTPDCSLIPVLYLFHMPFKLDASSFNHKSSAFFPNRQLFIARENSKDTDEGFIVTAKGGHNNEGHNHNDLGHFAVFCNGKPFIVDIGNGTYTRKTFSHDRYTIWWLNGLGHNSAIVNGKMQLNGKQYFAEVIENGSKNGQHYISFDLSNIYPADAEVKFYKRTVDLNSAQRTVIVSDVMTMKNDRETEIEINLYSPQKAVSFNANQLQWQDVTMNLDNIKCVSVREVDLKDELSIVNSWGKLYCITLKTKIKKSGNWKISFNKK